ncbi:hypothetical protein KKG58_05050 [Patescibacteria group bacterium]|nr:hypothetical protein [Patescibacteria group bacterium]
MEKIVIATHNPAKKERFRGVFTGMVKDILVLDDFGITEKPQEYGITAEENAEIKARFYSRKLNLPVFSEDEALYVDFLPPEKQPGVFVRRIEGKDEADDNKLLNYWERIIAEVPKGKRTGRWHIAYSLAFPNNSIKKIVIDHEILFFSPPSKIILPGWPMSSLEGPVEFRKPHSELTDLERKEHNRIADRLILGKLKELLF